MQSDMVCVHVCALGWCQVGSCVSAHVIVFMLVNAVFVLVVCI